MADVENDIKNHIKTLFENIERQSKMTHSGIVIATTAILDNQLERVLKRAMKPLSKTMACPGFG